MDLAVKWRFFRNLLLGGSDPDSERVYRWHIERRSGHRMANGIATDRWKLSLDDYVMACRMLFDSMQSFGFRPKAAVQIDPDGELLGGAHRVACALALEIKDIPVLQETRKVFAPPWDWGWFVEKGMMFDDLERLYADWESMKA